MKIHKVELRNVRHIKEVVLDLSAPLTVIGGPQGIGKSTVQRAILVAMFQSKKEIRDSLISQFDPSSPPWAELEFSREAGKPTIRLARRLTDETGEWRDGTTTIKQKGKALEKLQESLPISADAAALLLWGLQEDMVAVLTSFPPDGHTLLTAATIKGSGPDPKQIIEELENEFKKVKKSGKDPGALTRAESRVTELETELQRAREAEAKIGNLKRAFEDAKTACDQAQRRRDETKKQIAELVKLEELLETALKANEAFVKLEERNKDWSGLDGEIARAQRAAADLQEELDLLRMQLRVAKDREFTERIRGMTAQLGLAEDAGRKREEIETKIRSRKRPEKGDIEELARLQGVISESTNRMEASGLHYDLSANAEATTVRLSEDNSAEKSVTLTPGIPREGVVGKLVVEAGSLRIAARGKEDIASHKRSVHKAQESVTGLLSRFEVESEGEFQHLAEEATELLGRLKDAKAELDRSLKDSSLEMLRADLERLEEARRENRVTQQDLDAYGERQLASVAELDKKLSAKAAELDGANRDVKLLLAKRPTEDQRMQFQSDYAGAKKLATEAIAAFKDAEPAHRDPSPAVLATIKEQLRELRRNFDQLNDPNKSPENELARLAGELKHAAPERYSASIDGDLSEARSALHREQVLQSARELLKQRIQEKINEMTAEVPRELGSKISCHLTDLTRGACGKIVLTEGLHVKGVYDGLNQEQWDPNQLSHGERHQTALAIKIAVARALVETCGPVFIILDDSLVTFDPERRTATEDLLLNLVEDGKLQVILLTCHTDWAADWKRRAPERVNYIELAKVACYYRSPAAIRE